RARGTHRSTSSTLPHLLELAWGVKLARSDLPIGASATNTEHPHRTSSDEARRARQIGTYGCAYSLERAFCLGPSHAFVVILKPDTDGGQQIEGEGGPSCFEVRNFLLQQAPIHRRCRRYLNSCDTAGQKLVLAPAA